MIPASTAHFYAIACGEALIAINTPAESMPGKVSP